MPLFENEHCSGTLSKPELLWQSKPQWLCTKKQIAPRMNTDGTDLQIQKGPIELF
jgi:hypothetical protein